MRRVFKSKDKVVYKDDKTGVEKIVYLNDPEHKKAVKERLAIQPTGEDEREFFDRYKNLKKQRDGSIVDRDKERKRKQQKAQEIEEYEREEWKRRKESREPKYKKYY